MRILQEQADVGMKRPLVALERQRIITILADDLPGDVPLAIKRIDSDDGPLQ